MKQPYQHVAIAASDPWDWEITVPITAQCSDNHWRTVSMQLVRLELGDLDLLEQGDLS
jgi:hypothetical protein